LVTSADSDLVRRDERALASAQKLRFFPLAPVRGAGARLVEADGRELIDLSGSWSAVGLGHAHPAVVAAVTKALSEMAGASALSQINREAVGLAEELIATLSGADDYVAYVGLSGSDANAAARRCARAATGRTRVVSFEGSYHGGLGPGRDVSGLLVADDADTHDVTLIPYPDHDDSTTTLRLVEEALVAGGVAAIIVEPIMSDGGVRIPPPGFLAALHGAARNTDTVLVCDEVKVGLGRTGLLHAFLADGVLPDVITFGKSLGGGLPVSATVGRPDVMNAAPGSSLLTTAGNPVCAAAGRAVVRTVVDENLAGAAAALGVRLLTALRETCAGNDLVVDIRGRGLIAGLELPAENKLAAKVCLRAYQLGTVCYYVGPASNVVELTPPLVINDAEIDRAVELLGRAVNDVAAGRIDDNDIAGFAGW
jgi:4-aminobutyrate aminotransferase